MLLNGLFDKEPALKDLVLFISRVGLYYDYDSDNLLLDSTIEAWSFSSGFSFNI